MPYVVTQQTFRVRREQPTGASPYAAFFVTPEERLSLQYERVDDVAQARLSHELTVEVDALGHVTKSVSVAYGSQRPGASPEQQRTPLVGTEQGLLEVGAWPPTAAAGAYRRGLTQWTKSWELYAGDGPADGLYSRSELEALTDDGGG